MKRSSPLLLSIPLFFLAQPGKAQLPLLDIGLVTLESGQVEVRMRPDLDFDGLFAQLTFTVRWSASSTATLGEFVPTSLVDDYMYPAQVDGAVSGGYNYAVHVGLGSNNLMALGQSWTEGQEFVLGHFEVIDGPATFEIANDTWTGANNADYYVSLNGSEQTGSIYTISTEVADDFSSLPNAITLFPNPTREGSDLTIDQGLAGNVSILVNDATGRTVLSRTVQGVQGRTTHRIDTRSLHPGHYVVQVTGPGMSYALPWVVQDR